MSEMRLTKDQLTAYMSGLLDIRKLFNIPENKYYTVVLSPEKRAGIVSITTDREVPVKKISKSDT
jgi:hypothetical protein